MKVIAPIYGRNSRYCLATAKQRVPSVPCRVSIDKTNGQQDTIRQTRPGHAWLYICYGPPIHYSGRLSLTTVLTPKVPDCSEPSAVPGWADCTYSETTVFANKWKGTAAEVVLSVRGLGHTSLQGACTKTTSCAGGRHNMPPTHASWPLRWPFNLESGVRVTCDVGYVPLCQL